MRKLAQVLGTIGFLMPTITFAVGLGDIRVHSSLNQRLNAQVPVVDIGAVSVDTLNAQLASVAQFKLVGLERDPNLSKLKFQILRSQSGQPYIQINSTVAISAPVFTFLVNFTWPNGQMLREYTVFLDPVSYTRRVSAQLKPASADVAQSQVKKQSIEAKNTYGPVTSQDDLWAIAKKTRKSGTSIQQNMVALFHKNQSAFSDNNINGLRLGAILTLPSASDVQASSTTEAIQFLREQDKQWRARKTSSKQHQVETLPENLKDNTTKTTNVGPLNLVPENELVNEGDNFDNSVQHQSGTTDAFSSNKSSTQQVTDDKHVLAEQMVALQKQLIEKDREILTLEKLLSENKKTAANQPKTSVNPQGKIGSTNVMQTTQSATQAGEVKINYGLPWYTFPFLLFIVLLSLIAGVFIQKKKMQGNAQEGSIEKSLAETEHRLGDDKLQEVPVDAELQDEAGESIDSVMSQTQHTSVAQDVGSALFLTEDLINQGLYQKAIDWLLSLQAKNGKEFETSVKLLEVFGLAKQKENFINCYKSFNSEDLTSTQQSLLETIVSLFPEMSGITEAPRIASMISSEEPVKPTAHEEPTEFDLNHATSVSKDFAVSQDVEKAEITEDGESSSVLKAENPEHLETQQDNTIDFDVDLTQILQEDEPTNAAREKSVSENIDEQVWERMLDNLSIAPQNEGEQQSSEVSSAVDSAQSQLIDPNNTNLNTPMPESSEQDSSDTSPSEEDSGNIQNEEDWDTQLDLAKAYLDMGDKEEARDILNHVIDNGNDAQIESAKHLIEQTK